MMESYVENCASVGSKSITKLLKRVTGNQLGFLGIFMVIQIVVGLCPLAFLSCPWWWSAACFGKQLFLCHPLGGLQYGAEFFQGYVLKILKKREK